MLVMMAMMGRPPKGPLLRRRSTEEREEELEKTACLVAAMGKIAVKSACNAELAGKEHERAEGDRLNVDPGPENRETGQVNPEKKNTG
jgi:hypothetical protein